MKNRMAPTRSRPPPYPRSPEDWRAWEAASNSEFFNWFVFRPHRTLAPAAPLLLEDWIYFQDHAWDLDERARATIGRKLPLYEVNPAMRIVIGGIANQTGTLACGMRLGLRRVLSIRRYLLEHDVDPDRVGIAIRGTGWSLTERSGESSDLHGRRSECRFQVTDSHWVLARN